jgi:ATP-dependent Clp protease, protease subunit
LKCASIEKNEKQEGYRNMKNQESTGAADAARLEWISTEAQKYYNAFKAAEADGGNLAAHLDKTGAEALQKLTGLAGGSDVKLDGAYVPSVIETDANGNRSAHDLFSLLLKQRIVLLQGQVDDSMAAVACASLLYLDSAASGEAGKNIEVHIDSPGGSVIAGMAIYDVMRSISSPVTTIGMGMQASMGSILLAGGDTRMMTKGSKLMIHSIGSGTEGKQADQEISLDSARRLFVDLKAVYIRHIGLTDKFWDLTCAHDTWFSAEQAKKMGFIHEIIQENSSPQKKAPFEASAQQYLEFNQAARDNRVPKSTDEIKDLLQATSSNTGEGERLRPELLVELAQRPEFWTPELKAQKRAAAASNDNGTPAVTVSSAKAKAKAAAPTV